MERQPQENMKKQFSKTPRPTSINGGILSKNSFVKICGHAKKTQKKKYKTYASRYDQVKER